MQKITLTSSGNEYEHTETAEGHFIDGEAFPVKIEKVSKDKYLMTTDNKVYRLQLAEANHEKGTAVLYIDNKKADVSIQDKISLLLEELGMSDMATSKVSEIKAPMPGLILDILCEVGQEVEEGDKLFVLEAMKMENIIKSGGSGKIKSIEVAKGDSTEKNQILLHFE
ncbi:MAG: biotin/lipoyl-binding protein [Cyclobacteriaceae bacterium]|nr:acetyl-CoA carboxylase biotin carboxyl carrier protein subunit [Cyclobacteriaceae bacterium]MCH8516183.1 biotin/lipoyl-binding protein [Cyclobacteriaceae bacterium]